MRKSKKFIRLKQLTNNKKALAGLVSLVTSNVPNAKIHRYVRDHFDHKLIYDSSIGLLRKKIRKAFTNNVPLVDLLQGKGNHNRVPLKHVTPLEFLSNELDRVNRASVTNTMSNTDKHEAISLLRCAEKSNYLW